MSIQTERYDDQARGNVIPIIYSRSFCLDRLDVEKIFDTQTHFEDCTFRLTHLQFEIFYGGPHSFTNCTFRLV